MDNAALLLLTVAMLATSVGCAKHPVAYSSAANLPGQHERLERDIGECVALAHRYVGGGDPGIGRSVARAAGGTLVGVLRQYAGLGGGIGSAAQAGEHLAGSLTGVAEQQDDLQRRYVEYCLYDRGHDVIGWR